MTRIHAAMKYFVVIVQLVFVLSLSPRLQAQTPTPTPTPSPKSEEVKRLEEEKAQLDLQKGIAEDEKAIRDAKFPKPTTTPLAGTTTVSDGAVIESQMVAFVSMARAANKLVSALKKRPGEIKNLAIFNEGDVKLLLSYKVADKQLEMLRQRYGRLLADSVVAECLPTPSPSPSPGIEAFLPAGLDIAKSFLGSFVDLTALLRTNVEIKGQSFDIDEAPLVSEVFRAARCQYPDGINLFYPAVFPPDIDPQKEYEILEKLEELHCLRISAGKLIGDIEENQTDINESEAKVKTIAATIGQTEDAKKEAQTQLRLLIRAHCKNVSQNDQTLDEQLARFGLSGWLTRFCSKLPADQRERLFVLDDHIKEIIGQLPKLQAKLDAENINLGELKKKQEDLWQKLQVGINNKEAADDVAAQIKGLNEQFDKFIASLIQTETATGVNQLTTFIKAENLKTALPFADPAVSYWLQLKVIKAGGNNRIKTNLLWDIFTGGNRVSHSGGAIVEYILYDTTGKSVASDTMTEYTNYIKASKVKNLSDSTVDDIGCPCKTRSPTCPKED